MSKAGFHIIYLGVNTFEDDLGIWKSVIQVRAYHNE